MSNAPIASALAAALAAALAMAAPARAQAPEPARKLELTKMTGRWYEVARIPNDLQKDCHGATSDWKAASGGYDVVQTCRKGEPSGPAVQWHASARVIDPATNAKIRMTFKLGMGGLKIGLKTEEYWVLDHRMEQGWLIFGTKGGNYVWLMSRAPVLAASARNTAISRMRELGYDVSKLEFPRQR